ncbi:hypothetical protein [Nitrosomonas communis]|uniref:hypothetical protein n=1 Tax=Nitrosomonas communis TaxID=44574 RepID=UPI003D26E415
MQDVSIIARYVAVSGQGWLLLIRFPGLTPGNFVALLPVFPSGACSHWVSGRCSVKDRRKLPQTVVLHEGGEGSAP